MFTPRPFVQRFSKLRSWVQIHRQTCWRVSVWFHLNKGWNLSQRFPRVNVFIRMVWKHCVVIVVDPYLNRTVLLTSLWAAVDLMSINLHLKAGGATYSDRHNPKHEQLSVFLLSLRPLADLSFIYFFYKHVDGFNTWMFYHKDAQTEISWSPKLYFWIIVL